MWRLNPIVRSRNWRNKNKTGIQSKVELEYSVALNLISKILTLKCQWHTLERRLEMGVYNHKDMNNA